MKGKLRLLIYLLDLFLYTPANQAVHTDCSGQNKH